jgi:diguanylate cyclase (GGDEF)-like protein
VRQTDTVARIGGDEFVIKLDNPTSQDEVNYIAQRVIGVINETIEIKGHQIQVGASVGIALYPENGTTANELIQNADAAMYAAKRTGRNKFRLYSAEMVQGLNS